MTSFERPSANHGAAHTAMQVSLIGSETSDCKGEDAHTNRKSTFVQRHHTSTSHRLHTITNSTSRRPLTCCITNTLTIVFVHCLVKFVFAIHM